MDQQQYYLIDQCNNPVLIAKETTSSVELGNMEIKQQLQMIRSDPHPFPLNFCSSVSQSLGIRFVGTRSIDQRGNNKTRLLWLFDSARSVRMIAIWHVIMHRYYAGNGRGSHPSGTEETFYWCNYFWILGSIHPTTAMGSLYLIYSQRQQ